MYATRSLHAWGLVYALGALCGGVGTLGLAGCSGSLRGEDPNATATTSAGGSTNLASNAVGSAGAAGTVGANLGGGTAGSGGGSVGTAGATGSDGAPPAQPGPPATPPTIPQVPDPPPSNPNQPTSDAGTTDPVVDPPPPPVPVCKRGIAIGRSTLTDAALRPGIAWWYNWGSGMQQSAAGLEFTPMVWGDGFDVNDVVGNIPDGAQFLLGFNEPNFFAQADLSASEAAALWPQVEQIASARNLALVSPGVNFCGDDTNKTGPCHDTNPVDYLTDFFAACTNCQVDAVAVHWYNCDGASLTWYLDQFKTFGKPIWLTEFACAYDGDTSLAGQEAYMREALPLLEADPQIARYSWFSGDQLPNARLINGDGSLTSLGQLYASLPQENCL